MQKKKTITELRKEYPEFHYESFSYKENSNNLKISFVFRCNNIIFKPKIVIEDLDYSIFCLLDKKVLDNLIFHLGIIELFSYWKAFCSPKIIISAGYLDKWQINWWKDLLINGMGQYFFENKIDFTKDKFIEFLCTAKREEYPVSGFIKGKAIILPIGGGKDSATSIEIAKKTKQEISCLVLNPIRNTTKMVKTGGINNKIICRRKIEEKLLELNRDGYLNGHTPFVGYLSFLSILCAVLFNKKYIVFSNEKSSNEGNTIFKDREINHQYSKTFDFEKKFRAYSQKYLSTEVEYFSLLRPLYEIQIARLFSKNPQYFNIFLSCNEAQKTYSGTREKLGNWCGNCSKCLFVYIILSPFLSKKEILEIFKKDMFEDKGLIKTLQELTDEKKVKPLECVGTRNESIAGLYLSWKINNALNKKQPKLLEYFEKNILPNHKNIEEETKKILENWDKNNFVPEEWKKYLA
ncbi:hypothetical protein M0R01_02130 [bacterium]|nr:hypothetical protein [bacterium]